MEIRTARRKRYKTIEHIIAEQPWQPHAPHPQSQSRERFPVQRYRSQRLGVRISQLETELRQRIIAAGSTWHQKERIWSLPEEEAVKLQLLARVFKKF